LPARLLLEDSRKYRATSTMQVLSSMTMSPPEPMIELTAASSSKSIGRLIILAGMQPPEGPPVCTALYFFSLGMPPPIS